MDATIIAETLVSAKTLIEERGWALSLLDFKITDAEHCSFRAIFRPASGSIHLTNWNNVQSPMIVAESTAVDVDKSAARFITDVTALDTLDTYVKDKWKQEIIALADKGDGLGFDIVTLKMAAEVVSEKV
jgi:hypothetical protein